MTEQLDEWRAGFAQNAQDAGLADPTTDDAPAEQQADTATEPPAADDTQPRDEAGRFAAKEAEPAAATEPGDQPAVDETDETDDELQKYLAKYGGDTDKALRAAVEAQKLIGRQGSELGQIRQELAQRFENLEQQIAQPQQPAYTSDEVQQFLDENPAMAPQLAQRAKEIGDDSLYARAMDTWADIDRAGAMDYAGRIAAWELGNQLRQEFAPFMQQANETAQSKAVVGAVEHIAARHADFAEVIDGAPTDILDTLHPSIRNDLQHGDAQAKASALETLYYAARGVQSERQPQAQAAANAAAQQTARQQRTAAAVGSATQANPAPRETASNVEQWREDFRNTAAFRKAAGLT